MNWRRSAVIESYAFFGMSFVLPCDTVSRSIACPRRNIAFAARHYEETKSGIRSHILHPSTQGNIYKVSSVMTIVSMRSDVSIRSSVGAFMGLKISPQANTARKGSRRGIGSGCGAPYHPRFHND